MQTLDVPHVFWRYNSWRCEFSPQTPERGIFRVFSGSVRVIELDCDSRTAHEDYARRCQQFVLEAEARKASGEVRETTDGDRSAD